jgi:hypothetical protein
MSDTGASTCTRSVQAKRRQRKRRRLSGRDYSTSLVVLLNGKKPLRRPFPIVKRGVLMECSAKRTRRNPSASLNELIHTLRHLHHVARSTAWDTVLDDVPNLAVHSVNPIEITLETTVDTFPSDERRKLSDSKIKGQPPNYRPPFRAAVPCKKTFPAHLPHLNEKPLRCTIRP